MISYAFPDKCYYCGKFVLDKKVNICDNCLKTLPLIKGKKCAICGREEFSCFCKIGDFAFAANYSFMRYSGPCADIVKRFKFSGLPQLSEFMGNELGCYLKNECKDIKFDFVTFVPMHPIDEFRRKYNQSRLLAIRVAKHLDLKVVDCLSKRFSFKHQKSLNREERHKQIKGKFIVKKDLSNKTVLLIDDVFTTGATLNECAKVMKKAGAETVYTATFAISY